MNPPYQDPARPIAERRDDLLARMTVREKIAQLTGCWNSKPAAAVASGELFSDAYFRAHMPDGVGSVGPSNVALDVDVRYRNALQKYLREQTRLGVPAIVHDEGCHGLMKPEATSFPCPIGLASSWNPALVREIYDTVAREMRARGAQHALTPVIDVARDPRWGRTEETFGEDPFLNGRLGLAAVTGLQGSTDGSIDGEHVLATLKHYVAHGAPEGGLNCSQSLCGPRELRDVHLAPFAYVVREGKPASVMPSYNEFDGIPLHANAELLQKVLRQELGFEGLIVSDYFGVMRLHTGHRVAANEAEAARLALEAGVQLELPEPHAFPHLETGVANGTVQLEQIDAAVGAILDWKFRLGLFEQPYVDADAARAAVYAPVRRELVLRAAEQSIVLLKNDGNFLPLAPGRFPRIAVIGPNADVTRLGGYSGGPLESVSVLAGIRARVGAQCEVKHAVGCVLVKDEPDNAYDRWKFEDFVLASDAENAALIVEAREVAASSDLVILVLGETETLCREAYSDKVVGDATTLRLPGSQLRLIEEVLGTGKPVVVYLMHGRPLEIGELCARVPAVLEGWYMGQETGTAAARILFGDVCPSGKLTISLPRSVGHLPAYYSKKPFSACFPYIFSENAPLFPFGHGLSYTTFRYANLAARDQRISAEETTEVTVDVTNVGGRDGDEIVQLYVRAEAGLPTRPVKLLKGFERLSLRVGETRRVMFPVARETLACWDAGMELRVTPGTYHLFVGTSSSTAEGVSLIVE